MIFTPGTLCEIDRERDDEDEEMWTNTTPFDASTVAVIRRGSRVIILAVSDDDGLLLCLSTTIAGGPTVGYLPPAVLSPL